MSGIYKPDHGPAKLVCSRCGTAVVWAEFRGVMIELDASPGSSFTLREFDTGERKAATVDTYQRHRCSVPR